MSSDFSFAAWKTYCDTCVRPKHSHDASQLERLDRLLSASNIKTAWRNLASDVMTNRRDGLAPFTWQQSLHQVIFILICPPGIINKSELKRTGFLLDARRRFKATHVSTLPLIPAMEGENAERNWLALYLKTRIIPPFFNRKHYEEIAVLVSAALDLDGKFSADQVRLLRPYHFRNK